MKLLTDAFSGEEIISDSFNWEEIFSGVGIEVKSKYIMAGGGGEIDIGCGNAFGGEGGADQGGDNASQKVLDVLDAFKYQETSFTKKDYTTYIKGYMKKVKEFLAKENPERVDGFMKGAQEMVKNILKNFGEYTFYTPQNYDTDNCIILGFYKGEDETPTFQYFKDGLKETKL